MFAHARQSGGWKRFGKRGSDKTDATKQIPSWMQGKGKVDNSANTQQKPRRSRGPRRLGGATEATGNFLKYLQSKGFLSKKPKMTQAQKDAAKDKAESMRAAAVFNRFDNDHNSQM